METTVLLAALAIVSACVAALVWVIKFLFTEILPVIRNNVTITEKLIVSTEMNTEATKSSDAYLRERNGRDIHFHENIMKSLVAIQEQAKNQQVAEQTVEHQVVNSQS